MLDTTNELVLLLDDVLGDHHNVSRTDLLYTCPFCSHHKRKLQIHLTLQHWHCWVCDASGKSLRTLFKKIGVSREQYQQLNKLLRDNTDTNDLYESDKLAFPEGYNPLWIPKLHDPDYRNAMRYLENRGILPQEIIRYRIGYANSGPYAGKIIVPSYSESGKLNYFVSRAFYESDSQKHKNPKTSKDIIGFESFINWNLPVVLVEGVFDAFAVRINAIPLFGKVIQPALRAKLMSKDVTDIYICLDLDAKTQALKMADEFLSAGKNVYYINLKGKDPSALGFTEMRKYIRDAEVLSRGDLFTEQITNMFNI